MEIRDPLLEMLETHIDTITRTLASFEVRLLKLEKAMAAARLAGPEPSEGPGQGKAAIEAFDRKWEPIKKKWPGFRVHPKSCEAYETHCETLGGEPEPEKLIRMIKNLEIGEVYSRAQLEAIFNFSPGRATAYISFLKWSGLAVWCGRGIQVLRHEYKTPK
jgi:hypothetical protein